MVWSNVFKITLHFGKKRKHFALAALIPTELCLFLDAKLKQEFYCMK